MQDKMPTGPFKQQPKPMSPGERLGFIFGCCLVAIVIMLTIKLGIVLFT